MTLPALFYPAHDLALANGVRHFTPPTAATQLQTDLEALSAWWQPETASRQPLPWGWNYETRQSLLLAGVGEPFLPTLQELEELRILSSRETTIALLQQIKNAAAEILSPTFATLQLPQALTTPEELEIAIAEPTQPFLLKTPWSSSGRGLCWSRITPPELLVKRGNSILRETGCVIMEPEYSKIQDFAMLFHISRQEVRFIGYSIFDTDAKGTYQSGRMMSNENMKRYLSRWIPADRLEAIADLYRTTLLPALFSRFFNRTYTLGYIGVDMMVYENQDRCPCLHPCIELNARCTMGVVARQIFDRKVHPDSSGRFIISHAKNCGTLLAEKNKLTHDFPSLQTEEKFISGYIPLTPIRKESNFAAYMLLDAPKAE